MITKSARLRRYAQAWKKYEKINENATRVRRKNPKRSPKRKSETEKKVRGSVKKSTSDLKKKLTNYQKFVKKMSEKYKHMPPRDRFIKIGEEWKNKN
jgi:hypothetical protein